MKKRFMIEVDFAEVEREVARLLARDPVDSLLSALQAAGACVSEVTPEGLREWQKDRIVK